MKKIGISILLTAFLFILPAPASAVICGEVLTTDITAYIDEQPIESYNINGYTYVFAEDLKDYGFDVAWDGNARTLSIERSRNAERGFLSMEKVNIKKSDVPFAKHAYDVYETDIQTFIGGKAVQAYNIDGKTLIFFEDLAEYGFCSYDNNTREIKLDMAGFDAKILLEASEKEELLLSYQDFDDRTETTTYIGDVENGKPNGYGVIHLHTDVKSAGPIESMDQYDYGNYINGEKDGYFYEYTITNSRLFPENFRQYYSISQYKNGEANGYSLHLSFYPGSVFSRTETKGAYKREIVIDDTYRYGYRIEQEGYTDSHGQIIDYEKTEAGKISDVFAGYGISLVVDEKGDLYGFGDLNPYKGITKDVPVRLDHNIASAYAGSSSDEISVIDQNGNLYNLWDKIQNDNAPVRFQNAKKASSDFFLTNDGKLYRKNAGDLEPPTLIAEGVKDFSAQGLRILFLKNDNSVYFARFNYAAQSGASWTDGLDLSAPVKVFDQASAVSLNARNLVVDQNNVLWGWSSDLYHTPYQEMEDSYSTKTPIQIAADVTAADSSAGLITGSFIAYTKTDGVLYVCPDYTEPEDESTFGITGETKLLENVKTFSAGRGYLLIVKNDGTLWVWGKNSGGNLGTGNDSDASRPVQITDFYQFID